MSPEDQPAGDTAVDRGPAISTARTRTVLVTGAAGGIGSAVTPRSAAEGADVDTDGARSAEIVGRYPDRSGTLSEPPVTDTTNETTGDARIPMPSALAQSRVTAILRAATTEHVPAVARALVEEGIGCLEVTLTTPGALAAITRLRAELPAEVVVGAGSVISADEVTDCVAAGAQFIVSPATLPDVLAACREHRVASFPGSYTATEMVTAWRAGAAAVKVFPAGIGGPDLIRQLAAPMPWLPMMPTGGVDLDTVPDYLGAGAGGVALGGALLGDALTGVTWPHCAGGPAQH